MKKKNSQSKNKRIVKINEKKRNLRRVSSELNRRRWKEKSEGSEFEGIESELSAATLKP
jgi:hypothetical protein